MRNLVLIVNPSYAYNKMFIDAGWAVTEDVSLLPDVQLVCFTGGEDVSPYLYGEAVHHMTYANKARDEYEKAIFEAAIAQDKPCVGICRGGQFLNVMNGGKMYQHVNKHTQDHILEFENDNGGMQVVNTSSTHHQMMRPGPAHELLAWAYQVGVKQYMEGSSVATIEDEEIDTEVVLYPNTKCLCFQPHPEFDGYKDLRDLFFHFVNKYLI